MRGPLSCVLLTVALLATASCERPIACPTAPRPAPLPPAGVWSVPPPAGEAVLPGTYVQLPSRAGDEVFATIERSLWNRQLPRFFNGYQRWHFYKAPLIEQLGDGMAMPRTVLEQTITGHRLVWSQRPHAGASMVAMLFSPADELLSVAVEGADCEPGRSDCAWNGGMIIYVPKGKAGPDRIEPLRSWGHTNGARRERPERIVELP